MKEMLQSTNKSTNIKPKSTMSTTVKRRPLPTTKTSPDRRNRRMTMAPQSIVSRTQIPASAPPKMSARERRLSYLPYPSRRSSMLHKPSVHPTVKSSSPQKPKTVVKPKALVDDFSSTEIPKQPLPERSSTRQLDAYGIPINHRQKTTTHSHPQGSLDQYLLSKSKALSTATVVATTKAPTANGMSSTNNYNELHQRIRVCVRKRPLNKKEIGNQETDIVPLVGSRTIQLNEPKTRIDLTRFTEKHTFTFDEAFDSNASNLEIYAKTAQPLVEYIFTGGKATCFAHGQTGSGKTHTMLDPQNGLYVLAAKDIFRMLSSSTYSNLTAHVGFYEIYQGQLFDLLNSKNKLTAREDGNGNIVIAGLREYPVTSVADLMDVFEYGNRGRTTGKTGANNKSSRSHAVLHIVLKLNDESSKMYGKLSFIDLAGSERGADRGEANTKTRLEGAEINKSLLALKECIRALDQNKNHTPFRGSKLTQVLRDSFTGDSRTCMIATISPNNSNSEHTLNTLRYADRVKQLKGESDPRLLGDYGSNLENKVGKMTISNELEMNSTDSQSLTNSDAMWDEEVSENLFEVDFPTEIGHNGLSTPKNVRHYSVIDTSATAERQQKFLQRLESPPSEVFENAMDSPFFSSAYGQDVSNSSPSNIINEHKKSETELTKIRRFIRLHKLQVKEMEICIQNEKQLIAKLASTIPNELDLNDEDEVEDQKCKEEFEVYLNDLEEIMDKKSGLINAVSQQIKEELT
ncbi:MAG: P-loop containing nucleoside triphosphate hydrolase protein [Benjaminiella poitrasii]|nr:MAG: P-loop containing nucleoside triphosphate hydrolase protein [Benjaminiella poitrasii]